MPPLSIIIARATIIVTIKKDVAEVLITSFHLRCLFSGSGIISFPIFPAQEPTQVYDQGRFNFILTFIFKINVKEYLQQKLPGKHQLSLLTVNCAVKSFTEHSDHWLL